MEQETIIIVSVFGAAWLLVLALAAGLCVRVSALRRRVDEMQAGRIRVQKLKMDNDKRHAFHNETLSADEELSRRGYSMYTGSERGDPEAPAPRLSERQTGGQLVEELSRELNSRQRPPPFLLQSIENNKRHARALVNPVANGRQSDTNPNFIY